MFLSLCIPQLNGHLWSSCQCVQLLRYHSIKVLVAAAAACFAIFVNKAYACELDVLNLTYYKLSPLVVNMTLFSLVVNAAIMSLHCDLYSRLTNIFGFRVAHKSPSCNLPVGVSWKH